MKKKLTIDNFTSIITWSELKIVMGKREFNRFNKWMSGQTCALEGVYRWDLERYLKGLPCID